MTSVIEKTAHEVVGKELNTVLQCRKLIDWMHAEFDWTATDYKQRTVEEILKRRAGNCREQADVLEGLLTALGIEHRKIAEINIHPPSLERQQSAEELVQQMGPQASVFGYRHNDHRWLEVKDQVTGEWFPADATIGICGTEDWIKARMGFGDRPEAAVDMVVPISVFVIDHSKTVLEDRSEFYLVEQFKAYLAASEREAGLLHEWAGLVKKLSCGGKKAFEGEESFFNYMDELEQALKVYEQIKVAEK